ASLIEIVDTPLASIRFIRRDTDNGVSFVLFSVHGGCKSLGESGFLAFHEGCNNKFGDYFSIYRHVKTSDSGGAFGQIGLFEADRRKYDRAGVGCGCRGWHPDCVL
ncbi:hypothetical protein, partial [Paenibacillus hemerocallicola]|uniref:hypothetical protein n=1 Tax=Paenibacillus hemerocallicola TaxID=1172614 RepID=UPI00159EBBC2